MVGRDESSEEDESERMRSKGSRLLSESEKTESDIGVSKSISGTDPSGELRIMQGRSPHEDVAGTGLVDVVDVYIGIQGRAVLEKEGINLNRSLPMVCADSGPQLPMEVRNGSSQKQFPHRE